MCAVQAKSRIGIRGVTIIELLVSIFIISLLALGVAAFQRNTFKTSRILQTSLKTDSQIRKVFRDFTSEVRSASSAWNGAYIIESAATSSLVFYTTIDSDKYTERIRYQLVGNVLEKGVTKFNLTTGVYDLAETKTVVVSNINASSTEAIFVYYDKTYDGSDTYLPLQSPVDVSRIRLVRFNIPIGDASSNGTTKDISSVQVTFRNLKDNY